MKHKVKFKEAISSSKCTLILYALLYINFTKFLIDGMFGFVLDTAVQIKAGQWMIDNKSLINGDMFSWHEGLNWVPHEQLWYLLIGAAYNIGGIIGICLIGAAFNLTTITFLTKTARADKDVKPSWFSVLLAVMAAASATIYFPSQEIRPQVFSTAALAILIYYLVKDSKIALRIFPIITWLTALMHGGILKVFFIMMALWLIVELICDKNIKTTIKKALWILAGFVTSILTPNLFDTWTYAKKQEMYPEVRNHIGEWTAGQMDMKLLFIVLFVTIGIVLDERWKDKNKTFMFESAAFFMFAVSTVIYVRMQLYCAMFIVIMMPIAIENIAKYLEGFLSGSAETVKDKCKEVVLEQKKYFYTIANLILIVLLPINWINGFNKLPENTLNSAAEATGYDNNVVDFIKEHGYEKIYNDYNIGQWLLFNDIKVHIDNRLDPYLKSYSGEDNIHNTILIDNLSHLNDFYDKYHPDAIVICYETYGEEADNTTNSGEIYPHMNPFATYVEQIDKYESDRYVKVYDNTCEVKDTSVQMRWLIYECKYSENESVTDPVTSEEQKGSKETIDE